jgi:GH15 family glucan-1,4-alpha-glucosidase
MLVGLNDQALIKDLYFPYIGLENQTGGRVNKIVFLIDDEYTDWSDKAVWHYEIAYEESSLTSNIRLISARHEIEIHCNDVVYNESNVFIRKMEILNRAKRPRNIKVYFLQHFEMYNYHQGDTAFYHLKQHAVIHYKGSRTLLVSGMAQNTHPSSFTIIPFQENYPHATSDEIKAGRLSKQAIAHGKLESLLEFTIKLKKEDRASLYYWIAAGKNLPEVYALNADVLNRTPQHFIQTTTDYWRAWVGKQEFHFGSLSEPIIKLFKTSLLLCRSHLDNHGAVIASTDSDILQHGRDTYNYLWPRDGAFVVMGLDKAGYYDVTKRFFYFCRDIITEEGYFYHKYLPDSSLGSSWHPWERDGKEILPIQEDELALVVCALWHHYKFSRDLEMVEELYAPLIKHAAEFMIRFREKKTKLPAPCYDLWEEKWGISTFTASTVYGALINASRFADILGKHHSAEEYRKEAETIKKGILKYLYDHERGYFIKQICCNHNGWDRDTTIDSSSIYGVVNFKVLEASDPKVGRAYHITRQKLTIPSRRLDFARYKGDTYRTVDPNTPGNPWIICSLWYADYLIRKAKTQQELDEALPTLTSIAEKASIAGMLPEQIHPYNHEPISVSPLTWSHSSFVTTVMRYLQKINELGVCMNCGNTAGEMKISDVSF